MPKTTLAAALVAIFLCAAARAASPPKIVGDEGATIDDLIREQKYVTIVLNNGARDSNYRIKELSATTLAVIDGTNVPSAFPLDLIREVRVQKGPVSKEHVVRTESALTTDDRKIVDTATNRAFELFQTSSGKQNIKMLAAMALAASDHTASKDARRYLVELMDGNDTPTAVHAASMLWRVGEEPQGRVVENGLNSGNRATKAEAATLAGLLGDPTYLLDIRRLLKDPTPEIFPSAAKAAGRMKDKDSLPALYDGIRALNADKGEASVVALEIVGGSEVKQRLLTMLPDAKGNEWFRIVRVLHALGDEQAATLLKEQAIRQPAYDRVTALLLIPDKAQEAIEFMRAFLEKKIDPNPENLIYKARVGIRLYEAGDIQAKGIVQDVLNITPNLIYAPGKTDDERYKQAAVVQIQTEVCARLGDRLNRDFIPLLAAPIQSPNPDVAVRACLATLQIANPLFGERQREFER